MLRAEQRLRRSRDFTRAVRGGRRGQRGCLVVHLLVAGRDADPGRHGPDPGGDVRVGFVIPRTVGGAVSRNLVRRRLRHVAQDLIRDGATTLPAGSDLVVRVLPGAAQVPFGQLSEDLTQALARARGGARRDASAIGSVT